MPFEILFLTGIQTLVSATPWMSTLIVFFARWCIFLNLLPAAVLLRSGNKQKIHGVKEALWSALAALLLTAIIALIFQRSRPFAHIQEILLLIPPPLTTAFPSGHTSVSIAIACALFRVDRTAGWFSFMVAGFVMFGRMAAGVHFPSDIAGGICVGVLAFLLVRWTHKQLARA